MGRLKNVNLEFRESEFVSVLGPSGGGKTTWLNKTLHKSDQEMWRLCKIILLLFSTSVLYIYIVFTIFERIVMINV